VEGRPVNAVTTVCLAWCSNRLTGQGEPLLPGFTLDVQRLWQ
jgi:hypothetical protein